MFGLKIIKESELLELQMHKRMSAELLDPLKEIWPFIRDIRNTCEKRPEYLEGIKRGVVHIAFHPGCRPELKPKLEFKPVQTPPVTGSTLVGSSHTARMAGG